MKLAPIIVFAYKRPFELGRMLCSLSADPLASESEITLFCDGPKPDASPRDIASIREVQKLAISVKGFAKINVISAEQNLGLARSVIEGVTKVVSQYEKVIVIEDDAVVSPHFLKFMNDALALHAENKDVYSIGSWNYYLDPKKVMDNYFIRYPDSLAWGTWRRSWDLFEKDGATLLAQLKAHELTDRLDADGEVSYFTDMLKAQVAGKIDSWAIRWTVNCILQGKMNFFPRVSVALNKGLGVDATHEKGDADLYKDVVLSMEPITVKEQPVIENEVAIESWTRFVQLHFEGGSDTSLKTKVWRALPSGVTQWYARRKVSVEAKPSMLEFEPVSRIFGFDRGTPIDRYYIEQFLKQNSGSITGNVMEIQEDSYIRKFGKSISRAITLRYTGESSSTVRIGDLTRKETLPNEELDAFICTQTLNFIYDHHKAVKGLHHSLRSGGVALVTLAGLVQISRSDADQWGDFWRYTPQAALRMFEDVFGKGNVEISTYGNSYAAACLMKGFATEECDAVLLDKVDPDYPVVITLKAKKA